MPDLPLPDAPSAPFAVTLTRVTHSFTTRPFTKLNLLDGPFDIQLYQNTNRKNNFTSVDVQTDQSIHQFISIDIEQNDTLTIRMIKQIDSIDRMNITILIIYKELNELCIDGLMNIQCLNQIQTNRFHLHHRGTGSIKFKFNVNSLDAYLHSIGPGKFSGQVLDNVTIISFTIGNIDCRHLLTRKLNFISSGIGNVYVMAIDQVNLTSNGIGNIYYSGPLKQQIRTGLGEMIEFSKISANHQARLAEDFD